MINKISFPEVQNVDFTTSVNGGFHNLFTEIGKYYNVEPPFSIHKKKKAIRKEASPSELDAMREALSGLAMMTKHNEPKRELGDSLLVVCGNFGLSRDDIEYYTEFLSQFNDFLSKVKLKIVIVRGTNDNPIHFQTHTQITERIFTVPDYSIISTAYHNILCVGGGISITRSWIKTHSTCYFENEAPIINRELLEEIAKTTDVDYVVTPTPPTFIGQSMLKGCEEWAKEDGSLEDDEANARIVIDDIYRSMLINKRKIKFWVYSERVTDCDDTFVNNITFRGVTRPSAITPELRRHYENSGLSKYKIKSSLNRRVYDIPHRNNHLIGLGNGIQWRHFRDDDAQLVEAPQDNERVVLDEDFAEELAF